VTCIENQYLKCLWFTNNEGCVILSFVKQSAAWKTQQLLLHRSLFCAVSCEAEYTANKNLAAVGIQYTSYEVDAWCCTALWDTVWIIWCLCTVCCLLCLTYEMNTSNLSKLWVVDSFFYCIIVEKNLNYMYILSVIKHHLCLIIN